MWPFFIFSIGGEGFLSGVIDNWTESYESQGAVIPHGLGISRGLQEGVGLDDLVFRVP